MTWSFALVSACLFLFPGFCCLAGFIYAGRIERLSAVPDVAPQSTTSFVIVIGGAIIAHLVASGVFALQDLVCQGSEMCRPIDFDPNIYRAIITRDLRFAAQDGAIFLTLLGLVAIGLLSVLTAVQFGRNDRVQDFFRPSNATWLRDLARASADDNRVVLAYVMCKAGNDGVFAAYEGIVESLSHGANGQISNITLSSVDRFTIEVGKRGINRRGDEQVSAPIAILQIDQSEFSNIGFEILQFDPED